MKPMRCAWLLLGVVACVDRSTHTTSDALPTLRERQEFLERYVTFRRHYDALTFDLSFQEDRGCLGPSTTACDLRVHATVPAAELASWTDGLRSWAGPANPTWLQTIPGATPNPDDFEWWQGDSRDLRQVGVSKKTSEVVYWNVCLRN